MPIGRRLSYAFKTKTYGQKVFNDEKLPFSAAKSRCDDDLAVNKAVHNL